MIRCISMFMLSVSLALSSAAAGGLAITVPQTVQQETKADNLLLGEIPHIVTEWTVRCTNQEAARGSDTEMCWTKAASALTRYTTGLTDALIKQVEQLQASWLARAAQLQADPQTASTGSVMAESVDTSTAARQPPRRLVLPKSARPKAAVQKTTPPPTRTKSAVVAKRSTSQKEARTVKLVQSRKNRVQALKVIKKSKTNVVPAAVQRPIEASRYPSRRTISETYAIRDQLLTIEREVECSTLICAPSKKHKQ
jgi:hypothetical protein